MNLNKIERISKFASRFSKFSLDLQGFSGINKIQGFQFHAVLFLADRHELSIQVCQLQHSD